MRQEQGEAMAKPLYHHLLVGKQVLETGIFQPTEVIFFNKVSMTALPKIPVAPVTNILFILVDSIEY